MANLMALLRTDLFTHRDLQARIGVVLLPVLPVVLAALL